MSTVVCLVAQPATMPLTADLVERARRALPETEVEWLAREEAVELGPLEIDPETARRRVRAALDAAPVDVCALPFEGRRKQLLLADMDSTIIQVECVDELADALGIRERIAAITARAMNGEIPFAAALGERVALLEGLDRATLEQVAETRTPLSPGARTLVATMKAHGAVAGLVSGGFTLFTRRVRERCGFDHDRANTLEIEAGKLTGRVVPPIQDHGAKVEEFERLVAAHDLLDEDVIAIGDGANDVPMLQRAGIGVAYRAHQKVRAQVPIRLDVADLTGALYLQGYRRDEFVEG
jgi:phosphoserine phosphatase